MRILPRRHAWYSMIPVSGSGVASYLAKIKVDDGRRRRAMSIPVTNFATALGDINEYWSPRVVARVNDQYVKVAKLKGQLAWHKHDHEDELFQVVKGRLVIQFEDQEVALNAGEVCVVPRGVMHNPVAEE